MNFLTKNIKTISIALFALIVILVLIFSVYGKRTEKTLFCFDTLIDISLSGKNADAAAEEISRSLLDMEKLYSKYKDGSVVSNFNNLPVGQTLPVSDELAELVKLSLSVSQSTNGAFDITTSKLSDLWQIKSATIPPEDEKIKKALLETGYDKIVLNDNTLTKTDADIDFGGVLKGFASDKVREIAKEHDVKSGIVNLGGNVCLIGSKNGKPWTVGITDPFSPSEIFLTVEAENTNVITSGAYQRFFELGGKVYHHIISPETGYPAETDVASVSVISPDGTLADTLSTAIFVSGSEKGVEIAKSFDVDAIIIKKDGSVIATDGVKYNLRDN